MEPCISPPLFGLVRKLNRKVFSNGIRDLHSTASASAQEVTHPGNIIGAGRLMEGRWSSHFKMLIHGDNCQFETEMMFHLHTSDHRSKHQTGWRANIYRGLRKKERSPLAGIFKTLQL